ncbi:PilZ domain-containing protein [Anaeromyxobacter diazotrophicus]|uniref:PilZ domain-containing protein n=1 Tax=Anaeromyxobacter diazotrophicus TaxID=2590199 RepID=A0A7I9VH03_9BACT|nr:PilZ domain-containing protein [Anaeromyxobacter diazotrophicus]GEJ55671.1 hypothetical protein AMYX_04120 [Anaeromyxobacter diazotrophicus]
MSRRDHAAPPPPAEEDRRDSQRVPIRLLVRDSALGGSFEERAGNLSLGGVYFAEGHPPAGARVELRFLVPGLRGEVRCEGEILRVTRAAGAFGAHVRFQDLPLETELAIARYLETART